MIRLAVILLFVVAPMMTYSQGKTIAPPAESAAVTEQQKWLVNAVAKYGSYKTPTTSVKISAPKIDACVLSFTQAKKFGSTLEEKTLILTTRTDTVKDSVSIDLAKIDIPSLGLSDYILPELSTFSFRIKRSETNFRDMELVVQRPAADAIKTTLERVASACAPAH
jgi:hypothetical protein